MNLRADKKRLIEADLAKGLAIFLVVLGHIGSRTPPLGNAWFGYLTVLIYEFHMPLFMFLSGMVFRVTLPVQGNAGALFSYFRSRLFRLAPGFLLFALIIWCGKQAAGMFLPVDNAPSGSIQDLGKIFYQPSESVATSLWYIYVLLELTILFAAAFHFSKGRYWPVLVIAIALNVLFHIGTVTSFFALNLICEFAIFFALGAVVSQYYQSFCRIAVRHAILFMLVFAFSFLLIQVVPHPLSKTIIGLIALPAAFALVGLLKMGSDCRGLRLLAEYTFTIYLMNTLFIGAVKGLALRLSLWDGPVFLLTFPVILAAGIVGPILVHKWIFVRIPMLARVTR